MSEKVTIKEALQSCKGFNLFKINENDLVKQCIGRRQMWI
jgi:hypothetical protein